VNLCATRHRRGHHRTCRWRVDTAALATSQDDLTTGSQHADSPTVGAATWEEGMLPH
jgi:hypothetical protein